MKDNALKLESDTTYQRKKAKKVLKTAKDLESEKLKEGWQWITEDNGKTRRLIKNKQ